MNDFFTQEQSLAIARALKSRRRKLPQRGGRGKRGLPLGAVLVRFDPRLIGPFTALIAGPTGCGKSFLIFKILRNLNKFIYPPIDGTITYCYGQYQKSFEEFKDKVVFNEGLLSREELLGTNVRDTQKHHLLIIDDILDKSDAPLIRDIFIKGSHHQNMSVFFMTQNVFLKNPDYRTTSLNCHYMLIFKNPRDMSQFSSVARQVFPTKSKSLTAVYNNALEKKHSYLVLDFKQSTPDKLRIRGPITDKVIRVFVVKDKK